MLRTNLTDLKWGKICSKNEDELYQNKNEINCYCPLDKIMFVFIVLDNFVKKYSLCHLDNFPIYFSLSRLDNRFVNFSPTLVI